MAKNQRLGHDLYNSLTRISRLEIIYLSRKKLAISKQVKKTCLKLASFSLRVISDFY